MLRTLLFLLAGVLSLNLIWTTQKVLESKDFSCRSLDYKCYETHYSNLVRTNGVKDAFKDLKDRYDNDSSVKTFCHPLVHAIGRASSLKFANISEAFLQGDNFCSSGYYHGVLEGIAGKMGRDNLLASLNSICSDIRGKNVYSLDYYNCVHGLGHGLMAITDDELFESLTYCDKLTGDWEQKSCASGVFMENIVADGISHTSKFLKKDDLLYPCNSTPEKYIGTCYFLQSSYIFRQNNFDFSKTFDVCARAESDSYRSLCYQSLGRDASGFTISDISKTKKICFLGKNFEQRLGCFIGAARDFKYYFNGTKEAKKFCESGEVPSIIEACLKAI